MKNRRPTGSAEFLQSCRVAPSLPFLVKGGRKLNGLELIAAGRAAVTPGATVAKVVCARQGAASLGYPCTTQAPPGMPSAAPSHKPHCEDHLDGQEGTKSKMVNLSARAASHNYGSRISGRVRIFRSGHRRGGIRPLVRRTFSAQQPQRGIRPLRAGSRR